MPFISLVLTWLGVRGESLISAILGAQIREAGIEVATTIGNLTKALDVLRSAPGLHTDAEVNLLGKQIASLTREKVSLANQVDRENTKTKTLNEGRKEAIEKLHVLEVSNKKTIEEAQRKIRELEDEAEKMKGEIKWWRDQASQVLSERNVDLAGVTDDTDLWMRIVDQFGPRMDVIVNEGQVDTNGGDEHDGDEGEAQ
jgi:predicted RNase H-like nuclease (RuvC/YqgF family)